MRAQGRVMCAASAGTARGWASSGRRWARSLFWTWRPWPAAWSCTSAARWNTPCCLIWRSASRSRRGASDGSRWSLYRGLSGLQRRACAHEHACKHAATWVECDSKLQFQSEGLLAKGMVVHVFTRHTLDLHDLTYRKLASVLPCLSISVLSYGRHCSFTHACMHARSSSTSNACTLDPAICLPPDKYTSTLPCGPSGHQVFPRYKSSPKYGFSSLTWWLHTPYINCQCPLRKGGNDH